MQVHEYLSIIKYPILAHNVQLNWVLSYVNRFSYSPNVKSKYFQRSTVRIQNCISRAKVLSTFRAKALASENSSSNACTYTVSNCIAVRSGRQFRSSRIRCICSGVLSILHTNTRQHIESLPNAAQMNQRHSDLHSQWINKRAL